jgi:hypothetical protein
MVILPKLGASIMFREEKNMVWYHKEINKPFSYLSNVLAKEIYLFYRLPPTWGS